MPDKVVRAVVEQRKQMKPKINPKGGAQQTGDKMSRVVNHDETTLNKMETRVNKLNASFTALDTKLTDLATTAVTGLDQIIPHLSKMQSLLSQRGANHDRAGLPSWIPYAKQYAAKLDKSLRTVQRYLMDYREGDTGDPKKPEKKEKPFKVTSAQARALVAAQLAANELVAAWEHGGDVAGAVGDYKKVAVSPKELDSYSVSAA